MATETVTVPRFLTLSHPKIGEPMTFDLARFATEADRGAAFAKGLVNVCADAVAAKEYAPGAEDTRAKVEERLASLVLNPAGGTRAVDDLRDMLATSLGAKKAAARNVLGAMEAEQLALFADAKTLRQLGGIVGAAKVRIDALCAIADGSTDALKAAAAATVKATLDAKAAAAKAKAAAKA